MNVTVMSATERPIETISLAAGCCYGKSNVSAKRVASCYRAGHMSVFEHAYVQFKIEGISRACMAQLTRHRIVSFCVESQRYNRYDFAKDDDWCVIPPSIDANPEARKLFADGARKDALDYMTLLEMGVKPEDARYKLPEAMKTNLVMTCNVRELFHILDMREDKAAQWEIRDLAKAMREACEGINDEWRELMGGAGMTDSPSLNLLAEMKPKLAELSQAFEAMAEAMRPIVKAVADMANRLMPIFDEKRRRLAKVKALRADFIGKRGLRR